MEKHDTPPDPKSAAPDRAAAGVHAPAHAPADAAEADGIAARDGQANRKGREMTSKADLEAEVADLKRMLAEARAERAEAPGHGEPAAEASAEVGAGAGEAGAPLLSAAHLAELEAALGRTLDEAKALHARHPLLSVLAAFALGLALGRRR